MSWNADPKKPFRVRVTIVDDTYWDDGSRWTNRNHDFASLSDALDFNKKLKAQGYYETVSDITGDQLRKGVRDDTTRMWHWTPGRQWSEIKDSDAVSLLGGLANHGGRTEA